MGSDSGRRWEVDQNYTVPHLYDYFTPSSMAAELAWMVGAEGPVTVVSTGCTSGIDSVGHAAELIMEGSADVMVTGGTEAPLSPNTVVCFARHRGATPKTVVTGIGVAAPTALGPTEYWRNTLRGELGIGPITRFNTDGYWSKIGGEIRHFTADRHLQGTVLPQTDHMTRLTLVGTDWALRSAGVKANDIASRDIAVVTAATSGGYEFGQRELANLWHLGPDYVSTYYATTGPEIWADTDGAVDVIVCGIGIGIGIGGTLSGTARYLRERNPDLRVVGVEPAGSPVLTEGWGGGHRIPGLNGGFVAATTDVDLIDEVLTVTDDEAYAAARDLARTAGLLVGVSSGAAAHACGVLATRPDLAGKTIVAVVPDTGERYLSWLEKPTRRTRRPDDTRGDPPMTMLPRILLPGEGEAVQIGTTTHTTFKAVGGETDDRLGIFEHRMASGAPGASPHVHKEQLEAFDVLDGVVELHLDGKSFAAPRGTYVNVPENMSHGFRNPYPDQATMLIIFTPAINRAEYFRGLPSCTPTAAGPPRTSCWT